MFLQFIEVDNSAAIVVQFITILCFRYYPLDVLSSTYMGPFQGYIVSHATLYSCNLSKSGSLIYTPEVQWLQPRGLRVYRQTTSAHVTTIM